MSDVSFTVRTVSGVAYRSINLQDENLEDYIANLVQLVQEKDKMNSGYVSFVSAKDRTYVVIPLSDVAHIGIHNIPPEWLD
jgi:hypothetical protein